VEEHFYPFNKINLLENEIYCFKFSTRSSAYFISLIVLENLYS